MPSTSALNSSFIPPNTSPHKTAFLFPPPINETFLSQWYTRAAEKYKSTSISVGIQNSKVEGGEYFEVEAARNSSLLRDEKRDRNVSRDDRRDGMFGDEEVVVHVGDVVDMEWMTWPGTGLEDGGETFLKRATMRCVVCSLGVGIESEEARDREAGGVFEGCGNYTDTAHISQFLSISPPISGYSKSFTLPSLWRDNALPDRAVGICYFMLTKAEEGRSNDFSVAFPVAQLARTTPYRFNKEHPTGVADATISQNKTLQSVAGVAEDRGGVGGMSTGAIVGTVMGVLLGICLSVVVGWFVWRKEKRKGKKVTGDENELERVQRGGVMRDVETERNMDGEVPPAYHEVVKFKGETAVWL